MTLAETEYQSLRVHLHDLTETLQAMQRQMREIAKDRSADAALVFALAATLGTFNTRLEELEERLGV